jgi:hypothetical protein
VKAGRRARRRSRGRRCAALHRGDARGRWTDFNDLHQAHGLAAVKDQLDIRRIVERIESEHRARAARGKDG